VLSPDAIRDAEVWAFDKGKRDGLPAMKTTLDSHEEKLVVMEKRILQELLDYQVAVAQTDALRHQCNVGTYVKAAKTHTRKAKQAERTNNRRALKALADKCSSIVDSVNSDPAEKFSSDAAASAAPAPPATSGATTPSTTSATSRALPAPAPPLPNWPGHTVNAGQAINVPLAFISPNISAQLPMFSGMSVPTGQCQNTQDDAMSN
jgi:hypothetical protein